MSGLYVAAGALIGAGVMGAARVGEGWGSSILFGGVLCLVASLCDHYKDTSK